MSDNKDFFDKIMLLPVLRKIYPFYFRYKESILYLFFGVVGTVFNFICFIVSIKLGINELISNIIAWIFAVLFAYITNTIWVFQDKPRSFQAFLVQISQFVSGRIVTLILEEGILIIGIHLLHIPVLWVKIFAAIFVVIANYFISKWFVYKEK